MNTDLKSNVVTLAGPAAELCLKVAFDRYEPPNPTFPDIVDGTWGDFSLDVFEGRLELQNMSVESEFHPRQGQEQEADRRLEAIIQTLNNPVRALLRDGSVFTAQFAHLHQIKASVEPSGQTFLGRAEMWNWQHDGNGEARVWVGKIQGVAFRLGNLTLRQLREQSSHTVNKAIRLEGNYTWIIISPTEGHDHIAIIDCGERAMSRDLLYADFRSLEFSFGRPLKMNTLVGLDAQLDVTASMGLSIGFRDTTAQGVSEGPVPDGFSNERWRPVLFNRLARHLTSESTISLSLAIAAYLDTASDHIDGAYLKAQIALEATCSQFPKKKGTAVLVKNPKAWLKCVSMNEDSIVRHAVDEHAAVKLLAKVKSALNAPTSDTVEDALEALELKVSDDIVTEIRARGRVAHRYTMNSTATRDIQKDAQRLSRIKSVLVAIIARTISYPGPITGSERNGQNRELDVPNWWPPTDDTSEALTRFRCERKVGSHSFDVASSGNTQNVQ